MFNLFLLDALERDFQREVEDAFLELCKTGTLWEVENAINAGANVNAKNQNGLTPLMAATANSNPEVVTTLIRNGAIN